MRVAPRLFLCTLLAQLALALPAAGQEPIPEQPMSVSPSEGPPETVVTVAGSGCTIGTRGVVVRFTDLGAALATAGATADGEGRWEVTLQIPRATLPGDYTILADCEETITYRQSLFEVLEASESTDPASVDIGEDSRTSTGLIVLGVLGGLLFLVGVVLVVVERRRRRSRDRTEATA